MAKKNEIDHSEFQFRRKKRPVISMTFEDVDPTILTEPGKSQSVQKLYQDFVLGRLDPSQIAGSPQYDPEGSDEVDPFNSFGMTLEDADALRQTSEESVRNARKKQAEKTVANASADAMQAERAKAEAQGDDDK